MYRLFFFVFVLFHAMSASAITMTFDNIPSVTPGVTTYTENGITASVNGPMALGYWDELGMLHLDDSGSSIASSVSFATGGLFEAVSFDVPPYSLTRLVYEFYDPAAEEWVMVDGVPYNNVGVRGYRNGALVAQESFYSEDYSTYFLDALGFAGIDAVTISAERPSVTEIGAIETSVRAQYPGATDISVWCFDAPCGHFNIDNLGLDPVVAVPSPGVLPLIALGMLALGVTRRPGVDVTDRC